MKKTIDTPTAEDVAAKKATSFNFFEKRTTTTILAPIQSPIPSNGTTPTTTKQAYTQPSPTVSSTYFSTQDSKAPAKVSSQASTILTSVSTPNNTAPIMVNPCQKANKVLKYMKTVPWQISVYSNNNSSNYPDYIINTDIAVLFLSVRYHLLQPDYIIQRIRSITSASFKCRLLLCLVDVDDNRKALLDVYKLLMGTSFTILLGWSNQEIANYIETLQVYYSKSPDIIKERGKTDLMGQLTDTLTSVRSVNKTDVQNLLINFGNLKSIMSSSMEDISLCPGLGEKKVKRMYNVFQANFIPTTTIAKQAKLKAKEDNNNNNNITISFDLKRRKTTSDNTDNNNNSDDQ